MQQAHSLIAKADDLLWTGERAPATVAVLLPRSAFVWDTAAVTQDGQIQVWENMTQHKADYEAEVWGIYTALTTHSAVSIDFVEEDGLTEDHLNKYKLLLVTAPDVPSENLHAVTRWMRSGGTLLTTAGAARKDRYDSPDTTVTAASGIEEEPHGRQILDESFATGTRWSISGTGVANWQNARGSWSALGNRSYAPSWVQSQSIHANRSYSRSQPTTHCTFSDGSPAIVSTSVGSGQHFHFYWLPGLSYVENATNWERLPHPEEFPETIRQML